MLRGEDEALNTNTKMCPNSEIKSINVFNVGIGFGRRKDPVFGAGERQWEESCEYHVQKDKGGVCLSRLKRQVEGGYLLQCSL